MARYMHLRGWRIPHFPGVARISTLLWRRNYGEEYEQNRNRCSICSVVFGLRVLAVGVENLSGGGIESKFFDCDQQQRPGRGELRQRWFLSGVDLEPHQRDSGFGAERE